MSPRNTAQPFRQTTLPDEIDVGALRHNIRQFSARHIRRLERARQLLPKSSRTVLDALPYLLHVNSPSLPGYCGPHVPAGISNYQPSNVAASAIRQVAPTHRLADRFMTANTLQGVYFMGSAGSVAQTRNSDLDIWVCVERSRHAALQPKLNALTTWAAGQNVELQCFAVDPQQFSGTARQSTRGAMGLTSTSPLLLDEFYRSACLICGKFPLWWLVPPAASPQEHTEIAQRLIRQKFVREDEALDFGPVHAFGADHLLTAAIRELEHGLQLPHKALLKLALLLSYQQGAAPLSTTYKHHVLNDAPDHELDVYLMLGDHLDQHFSTQGQTALRDFLRYCWFTKTVRGNTQLTRDAGWTARAEHCGYHAPALEHMRWPQRWSLQALQAESDLMVRHLNDALGFARSLCAAYPDHPEVMKLERIRHVLAQFAKHPENLLPALVPVRHHSNATIRQVHANDPNGKSGKSSKNGKNGKKDASAWQLHDNGKLVLTRSRLVEIILWLIQQGFNLHSLSRHTARVAAVEQSYAALMQSDQVVLLNVEVADLTPWDTTGNALITQADDPLSYSLRRICLVQACDVVEHSPAGTTVHSGTLAATLPRALALDNPHVVCVGDIRRGRIQARVRRLLGVVRNALTAPGTGYALQLGRTLCLVVRPGGATEFHSSTFKNVWEAVHVAPTLTGIQRSPADFMQRSFTDLLDQNALNGPSLWVTRRAGQVHMLFRAPGARHLFISPGPADQTLTALRGFCRAFSVIRAFSVKRAFSDKRALSGKRAFSETGAFSGKRAFSETGAFSGKRALSETGAFSGKRALSETTRLSDPVTVPPAFVLSPSSTLTPLLEEAPDANDQATPDRVLGLIQTDAGWQVQIGGETRVTRTLSRGFLKQALASLAEQFPAVTDSPQVTHLHLTGGDFLTHLRLKLRLERVLRRLQP